MTRLLLPLIPFVLAACAATPKPDGTSAQGDTCERETQVGSMLPRSHCRSASQRALDRAGVEEVNQALKNHPVQSPMPTGGK